MKRIYLIALISALVAGIATYMFAQSVISNNDPNKDKSEVVYAITDVPAGTQVTAGNVNTYFSTRMIDNAAIVDGAVRSLDEVVGNTSSGYIYAGEQVSIKRFGTEQEANAGLSYNPSGWNGCVQYVCRRRYRCRRIHFTWGYGKYFSNEDRRRQGYCRYSFK